VTEHVQEEERDILPRLTAELTAERLATLGEEAEQLKTELTAQAKTAGPLIDLTKEQLYELAQEKGIEHRSEMSKDDLIAALRES
jgi:hypothetical protein